jgi:Ni/Fe-hydrogenase subunit HybB-like protein
MMTTRTEVEPAWPRRLELSRTRSGYWSGLQIAATIVVLLGIVIAPERTWPNVLLAATYFVGLGLAGMLFLAFHYLTTAGWSVCLKRIAEALASTLPIAAVLILFSLGGIGVLYEWSHADVVAADPILQGKAGWLNAPFFIGRTIIYLAVWLLFYRAMARTSRTQDTTGGLQANRKSTVLSAAFMAAFIVTFSLSSFDWLMSLQPHWFSTIFAGYNFAGAFVSGLSVIAIAAILLRRHGQLAGVVTEHHLHDLGKLILGFSTFWMYLWFSQYMLIWYGNLPEEVTFYEWRHKDAWAVLSLANLLVNWVIPFLVLLPRSAKQSESTLLRVCALLLIGRWLDLYLIIQPVFEKQAPVFGIWEIAPIVGAAALFVVFFRRGLAVTDLVPKGDPYLKESLRHHT